MANTFEPNQNHDREEKRQEARRSMEELQQLMSSLQISTEPKEEQIKPSATISADQTPEMPPEPENEPEQTIERPEETIKQNAHSTAETDAEIEEELYHILNPKSKHTPHHTERPKESTKAEPVQQETVPPKKTLSAREQRRRKRKIRRMCLTAGAAVVILAVLAVAINGISKLGGSKEKMENTGSGEVVEQQQPKQDNRPASQQESEQYLALKNSGADVPSYQLDYPGMYSDAVSSKNVESEEKVCYLTFDDGPSSSVTPQILDTLKEKEVKATFFVVTNKIEENADLVKRIVDEGHTLAIHANEHDYEALYESVDSYLADFAKAYDKIYELTGYRVQYFRFPGGSNNGVMSKKGTYDEIVGEMTRRGFEYFDWNAYDHDAEGGNYSVSEIVEFAIHEASISSRTDVIMLMHDGYGKEKTAEALPSIINGLRDEGIELRALTGTSRPVHFNVNDNTPPEFPKQDTEESDTSSDDEESENEDSDDSEN